MMIAAALCCIAGFTAAQAQEMLVDVKAGTSYAKDPEKFGFNSAVEAGVGINPYFALVAMPGFTWFSWDQGTGVTKTEGVLTSELKESVDGYMFPVLVAAKLRLPDFKESLGIVPYVTVGVGYSWLKYSYSTPEYTDENGYSHEKLSDDMTFKGLTWLVLAGIAYKLGDSNMSVLLEGGYRGAKLEKDDFEVDMSGFVVNAGVSFALGGETF
ncbi:MAG: outer membrane beta-barrel protein, partial [Spirochaetota bacterium]